MGYGPQFAVEAEDNRPRAANDDANRPTGGTWDSSDPTFQTRTEAERVIGQIEETVASLRAELAPYLPSHDKGDR